MQHQAVYRKAIHSNLFPNLVHFKEAPISPPTAYRPHENTPGPRAKKPEAKRLSETMPDMCKDELLYSQKLPAQNTGVQPLESVKLISALDPMRILTWSRCPSSAASDSEVRPSLSIQSRRPALSIRSLNESVGRHSTAKKMLVRPSELQKFKVIPLCCKSLLSTLHSDVAFAKGDMPSIWKLMSSNEFLR